MSAVLGIRDVFPLKEGDDVVVVGRVEGTIREGDTVYLTNCGEDDAEEFATKILGIDIGPSTPAMEATDCNVGLRIENGKQYKIKKGTVLFTQRISMKEISDTYTVTLGDVFVAGQKLDISDEDFELLSMADLAEIWRLFVWFKKKMDKDDSEEARQADRKNLNRLGAELSKKILNAEAVYCVYNKATGEPHMYSGTFRREDGSYMCSPPQITIGSKSYGDAMTNQLDAEKFEVKKIENGEDKKGIYNFLGNTIYLNGVCEIAIQSNQVAIGAEMLVPKPDYSNIPKQNIPVTNPDVVRWMLLIGQMGEPTGEDKAIIYRLYYKFLSKELAKAKLLIPMQHDGEMPKADENGKAVLKKDTNIKLPTMKGKDDRPALRMYTDWKRLRMAYGDEWGGLVQTIDGMINVFDCAINVTQYPAAGCYISPKMFEEMKELADK